ncbi:hypothetical protein NDU88_003895 [Pleurodeles waltl]|uniref:Uncharacterized protein n=1 Tax=Pleurodeles waltl TaxID=8319 RepID=A0AAV7TPW3_PLEWA|nr:hypothetical protein NDU88_003895 [Pleurodeles waltl]
MPIQPRQRPQGKKTNRRLNVSKLERHSVRQNLSEDLNSKLDQLSFGTNGAEEEWAAFRDVVHNTTIAHLDQNTRKHQDWFDNNDEDIQKLLDEKREAFRSLQQDTTSASKKTAYNTIKSKVQAKLREMQDSWLSRKANEIQKHTDSNTPSVSPYPEGHLRATVHWKSPLLSADGSTLLTEKNTTLKRWAKPFNNILNRPSSINAKAIDRMPQIAIKTSPAEPPKESEVKEAIKLLSNGKAPGSDSIPAEIYKAGGTSLVTEAH